MRMTSKFEICKKTKKEESASKRKIKVMNLKGKPSVYEERGHHTEKNQRRMNKRLRRRVESNLGTCGKM